MHARCITVDWTGVAKAIGLSINETEELFTDGRVSGELLQRIAIRQFGLKPSSNCDLYDAQFPITQEKIEIRLITRNGLQTRPSNQIGAKREFDQAAYVKKLETIEYFLLIDLRSMSNNIPCYLLPSSTIRRFFQQNKLDKGGSTRSFKTIASVLMESVKIGWDDGLEPQYKGTSKPSESPPEPAKLSDQLTLPLDLAKP